MPTYTFYDTTTRKEWTEMLTIAEMEKLLADRPHIQWVPAGAPPILDSVRLGIKRPDSGFRDILKQIKKKNPGSTVNTF